MVHGDFHPGNWRCGDGPPVILDFADAHLGNPVLDGLRAQNVQVASGVLSQPPVDQQSMQQLAGLD